MRKDRDKPLDLIQIHATAITGARFERRLLSRDPLQGIKGGGKARLEEWSLALYRLAVALKLTKDKPLFITELKGHCLGGDAVFRENKITFQSLCLCVQPLCKHPDTIPLSGNNESALQLTLITKANISPKRRKFIV